MRSSAPEITSTGPLIFSGSTLLALVLSMPDWDLFVWSTGHLQSDEFNAATFNQLKAESGRAYFEMALWFLDKTKASKVLPENIKGPVLVISGAEDRIVVRTNCCPPMAPPGVLCGL